MGNIIGKTEYNDIINEKTPLLSKHYNENNKNIQPIKNIKNIKNTKNKDFIYICF